MEPDSTYIGWKAIVVSALFIPIQVVFVVLRFWAQRLSRKSYDWDDWLVIASLLTQVVASALAIGVVLQGGVGYHIEYHAANDPEKITNYFKYLVAISIWYTMTMSLAKLAILVVYRRLFPQRLMHISVWIVAVILILQSIVGTILLFVVCRPFWVNWGPLEMQQTHCFDKMSLFLWISLPNIITDLALIALPLPIIWKLQLSNNLKAALTVTFLIGGSGLVASIMRFREFASNHLFPDVTWNAVGLVIWTVVEPGIYLISVSMMMYRPLLERVVRTAKTTVSQRSTGTRMGMSSKSDGLELTDRTQNSSHRFERLHGENDEEALRPKYYHPGQIEVRKDIVVTRS
ncbi:unnamed protein product [Clonostachys rosea]|uniref:Rhodopsin domain-containing protein n=1 Tax=Bionectria ochroleuca TaxID=29856 RepID=A0ABY6TXP2_BIOOC|nr:unnamed protein product [Clonostachys rosea]